ncbi:hypothetical protein [Hymenobacter metallicola]|uniref:Uncharacterized protein n=1 Tax=Hymenobacter metallicola TaxID=2563114 RepID=A0A4Z0QIM0_9BACT|nr:hypothetical protein [Hymenobacter metallicola]TGE28841.1 hypothetical protein E5K02_05100 [Hymenobacter metallicola]
MQHVSPLVLRADQTRPLHFYTRLLGLLLTLLPELAQAQAQAPATRTAPPVSTILLPDGTVRTGANGSFDATD